MTVRLWASSWLDSLNGRLIEKLDSGNGEEEGGVESIDTAVGREKWDFVNTVLKSGCIKRRKFL